MLNAIVPPVKEAPAELVLLMNEPLIIDAGFLRSAYQDVLGLNFDDTTGKATEFVSGQSPFFFLQTGGVLVGITVGDCMYGHDSYREAFPHHDISAVRKSLSFLEYRRIRKHQGWVGSFFLREQQSTVKDPYLHVVRALAPFALSMAAIAIVAPKTSRATVFKDAHQEAFRKGDIAVVLRDLK